MTILGLRSQASASGEVDVGAGVEGEFGTNGFGVYGEGSAHAEAKASGDLGQDIGVNLPFGGFGTNLHGAAADAGVTYQDGKVNVDLSADAALGLGFGGGVSASINVRSIAQEGVNFVNKLIP